MDMVKSAWIISVVIRTCFSLSNVSSTCGIITIQEPAYRNTDVTIVFQCYSLEYNSIAWKFYEYGQMSVAYKIIPMSSNEHSFSQRNNTFKIVIKQADIADQGFYYVYVTDKFERFICFSGVVKLRLQDPPRDVHFATPNKSFSGCEECLYAEYHQKLEVECSFTDGSEEESVIVQLNALDGRKTVETANRLSRGRYAAAFSYLREYNHLANVTCQVSAPTLPQPLIVTSKLYVLRRPDTPILTVGFLTDGQSPNISCQSDNSRPPPKLFYMLEEQTVDVNQTNESYIDNNAGILKYRSFASIHSVERSWNNKKVTCCLRHETLDGPLCSYATKLHYHFPPSAVHLSFTNIYTTTKQDDTINVTCVVVNANPVCGAIISVNDVEISIANVSHKQNEGGGMTTVVKASLNVVPEDDGKRVICTANCSMFATNQTDSFALDLRDDLLVTSQDLKEMIVLIVVPLAAVILLGTIVVVIVVCVRRRNVSRSETNQASFTEPEGYYQTLNRAEGGQSSIYNELELNVYANDK